MKKYLNLFKKLSNSVVLPVEAVIIGMMAVMAAVTIAQVFMRYVMHSPLRWSEELARYLMAWVAFLAAGLGIREGVHIGLEVLIRSLSQRARQVVSVVAKLLIVVFLVIIVKEGVVLCRALAFQRSPAMRISMFWPYFSVPTGALLMIVQMLPLLFEDLQGAFCRGKETNRG